MEGVPKSEKVSRGPRLGNQGADPGFRSGGPCQRNRSGAGRTVLALPT